MLSPPEPLPARTHSYSHCKSSFGCPCWPCYRCWGILRTSHNITALADKTCMHTIPGSVLMWTSWHRLQSSLLRLQLLLSAKYLLRSDGTGTPAPASSLFIPGRNLWASPSNGGMSCAWLSKSECKCSVSAGKSHFDVQWLFGSFPSASLPRTEAPEVLRCFGHLRDVQLS